jgi:predicted dehydrogenase
MADAVRVGVFGVGSLGQHHARLLSELPDVRLVGVYDVNAERAAEVAARHGVRAFTSPEDLAGEVHAASVVVPTDRHHAVATALIERGIHLLVEKPIAASVVEAEAIVEHARRRGVILQVGHVERFNPVMRFLEDHLSRPRFIEAIRLAPFPPPREGGKPRGTEVSVVLDLMIHDLDIILQLVRSKVKDLHAVGVPVLSTTEDIANARLVFENGCVANVTASRVSQERIRKIRVFQTDTYVSLDYMKQAGMLYRRTDGRIEAMPVPIEKVEPLAAELASFVDCVRYRRAPVVTGEHGFDALELAVRIAHMTRENPA